MKLLVIFGPPAVGKATVGREVAKRTGFKLFHNHVSLDAVQTVFPFGTPEFSLLVNEFRLRVIEEAARADVDLIFTFAWAFDSPGDRDVIDAYKAIVEGASGEVMFVELLASQAERMRRNGTEDRARMKARSPESRTPGWIAELDTRYRMVAPEPFYYADSYLRLDITELPPEAAARAIVERFGLASSGAGAQRGGNATE